MLTTASCLMLAQVQLQLLTAIVKLFLKKPADTQELVQNVLSLATQVLIPFCLSFGECVSGTMLCDFFFLFPG